MGAPSFFIAQADLLGVGASGVGAEKDVFETEGEARVFKIGEGAEGEGLGDGRVVVVVWKGTRGMIAVPDCMTVMAQTAMSIGQRLWLTMVCSRETLEPEGARVMRSCFSIAAPSVG